MSRPRRSLADRFADSVAVAGVEECWLWTGGTRREYGAISIGGKRGRLLGAHRVAFEFANGPIPAGLVVRHRCDVRLCCNPSHLELGTTADNNADKVTRGRQARGSRSGNSKLTEADVVAIRDLLVRDYTQKDIAARYKVSQQTISYIKSGAVWRLASPEKEKSNV